MWLKMLIWLICVVLLIILAYYVINPSPLKLIVLKTFAEANYTPNQNAEILNLYTIYKSPKPPTPSNNINYLHRDTSNKNLIVMFVGGAFLFGDCRNVLGIGNYLNDLFKERYDIVTFDYPVRFKYTLKDTMLHINKVLINFIMYENIHVVSISAGTLLAGAFYRKEQDINVSRRMQIPQIGIRFKSFIGLSGLYETTFNSDVLTSLFRFYIMRGTPGIEHYTCFGIDLPKLIITATSDFLFAQSVKFIQNESNVEHEIYRNKHLPHAFMQLMNLDESQKSMTQIYNFIERIDKENNNNKQYSIV
jgi:hypothetical protein